MIQTNSSIPSFSEFSPNHIQWQREALRYIKNEYDYSLGVLEVLFSGSVGSAKSLLAAHLAVDHCIRYPGAGLLLGRRALPDLKETIFQTIVDHLEGTDGLIEGVHYKITHNTAKISFCNGSKIISRSWADKKYKKFRSLILSAAIIEELTENDEEDSKAYVEITMRVGRLPHIPQSWVLSITNPDGPDHWAYDRFMKQRHARRKVFYSKTYQNIFLPKTYIEGLKENLDPKMAQRMLEGLWVHITGETIYYQYSTEFNYINEEYKFKEGYPVFLAFDFNIGLSKPLSSCVIQKVGEELHIFGEAVIEGLRTLENLEILVDKGYLDYPVQYIVTGDAAGKHKDTRNNRSDYDIIKSFLSKYQQKNTNKLIDFKMEVPASTPPIKRRHNEVNAYCLNANGIRRLFVYKGAPTADKGLRLTKLKKGSYIEDDSKEYQHITTAIGYTVCTVERLKIKEKQGTKQL